MKKIFVTRRLLKENEDKLKELFDVTLNTNDKTYKPEEIKVPSHAKIFNYDKLYEVANYIQMLTGFKVNIQEHDIEYKKHIAVDKKQIYKMYQNYIEEIQWDNI